MIVTSGEFTDPARKLAPDLGVELYNGRQVVQQLNSSSVYTSEYTNSSQTEQSSPSIIATLLSTLVPEQYQEVYWEAYWEEKLISSTNKTSNRRKSNVKRYGTPFDDVGEFVHLIGIGFLHFAALLIVIILALLVWIFIGEVFDYNLSFIGLTIGFILSGLTTIMLAKQDTESDRRGTWLLGVIYLGTASICFLLQIVISFA